MSYERLAGAHGMNPQDIKTINYGAVLDEQLAAEQRERVTGLQLTPVGPMSILAPTANWQGAITVTGEKALDEGQQAIYRGFILNSVVPTVQGGKRECMDGRGVDEPALAGPATAGGTVGDAYRVMIASRAYDPKNPMSWEESVAFVKSVDEANGFISGGHELGQCGAFKFAPFGIQVMADAPELVSGAVNNFMGAVEQDYSDTIQNDLTRSAQEVVTESGVILPSAEQALALANPHGHPTLNKTHEEHDLVVFMREGVTLDNNALIAQTTNEFGREIQAFRYNWDWHQKIAKALGGSLAEYYLQSVPSQDAPVLTQLTDGTVNISIVK